MRLGRPTLWGLVLWACLSGGCATREVTARTFRVLRVVDGDTFVIRYDGEPTYVRLFGVDAPEPRDSGGPAAMAVLRRMIEGRSVRIEFSGRRKRDNFGRLLCRAYVGEVSVGATMVRAGHAVPYRKGE